VRIRFLGTGTSYGVPMIGCGCGVCRSDDPRDRRLRTSALVESGGSRWLIDAGPDLRAQLLASDIAAIDGVFLTHFHSDHVMGLDDLRAITDRRGSPLPVWAPRRDVPALVAAFPHLFGESRRPGWSANLELRGVGDRDRIDLASETVRALEVPHGRGWSTGWVFGSSFAYFTDLSEMPSTVRDAIRGVDVLAIDMLREEPHPTHLNLAKSLEIAADCAARATRFIHMSHEVKHAEVDATLPDGVRLAYDGSTIESA